MHNSLPMAIARERDELLDDAVAALQREGYAEFRIHEHAGYEEPKPLRIPVFNTELWPDIVAEGGGKRGAVVACVEVSTNLSEADGGRRWQAIAAWARAHDGRFLVFVHPADAPRARDIAAHWHLDPGFLRAMTH